MAGKPRARTQRRVEERDARRLVRDRERLAALERGGAAERPIEVPSAAVIEVRARSLPCVQCEGEYDVGEHRSEGGLRVVAVRCRRCHVGRDLWFRIAPPMAN